MHILNDLIYYPSQRRKNPRGRLPPDPDQRSDPGAGDHVRVLQLADLPRAPSGDQEVRQQHGQLSGRARIQVDRSRGRLRQAAVSAGR